MVEGRVEVAREAEESDLEVQDQEDLGVGEDVERQGREGRGGHTALSISRRSKVSALLAAATIPRTCETKKATAAKNLMTGGDWGQELAAGQQYLRRYGVALVSVVQWPLAPSSRSGKCCPVPRVHPGPCYAGHAAAVKCMQWNIDNTGLAEKPGGRMLHDTVDSSLGVIARGNRTHPRVCRRHSCYHESPAPQFQRPIDVEMLTYSSLQSKFTAIEETFSTAKRAFVTRHSENAARLSYSSLPSCVHGADSVSVPSSQHHPSEAMPLIYQKTTWPSGPHSKNHVCPQVATSLPSNHYNRHTKLLRMHYTPNTQAAHDRAQMPTRDGPDLHSPRMRVTCAFDNPHLRGGKMHGGSVKCPSDGVERKVLLQIDARTLQAS
ncbi:hypothetical protein M8818_005413 [Zalaria obscura]|uniref:Uncharacterized protein n=1 Tax=Zalaria obscura TaxID=2024903 RepID=A0ACC3S8B0_9PEZI